MGFIKKQLLKVIKWDDPTKDTIVYRYPMEDRDEIMNGCQLIVQESQVALLVSGGQIGLRIISRVSTVLWISHLAILLLPLAQKLPPPPKRKRTSASGFRRAHLRTATSLAM